MLYSYLFRFGMTALFFFQSSSNVHATNKTPDPSGYVSQKSINKIGDYLLLQLYRENLQKRTFQMLLDDSAAYLSPTELQDIQSGIKQNKIDINRKIDIRQKGTFLYFAKANIKFSIDNGRPVIHLDKKRILIDENWKQTIEKLRKPKTENSSLMLNFIQPAHAEVVFMVVGTIAYVGTVLYMGGKLAYGAMKDHRARKFNKYLDSHIGFRCSSDKKKMEIFRKKSPSQLVTTIVNPKHNHKWCSTSTIGWLAPYVKTEVYKDLTKKAKVIGKIKIDGRVIERSVKKSIPSAVKQHHYFEHLKRGEK